MLQFSYEQAVPLWGMTELASLCTADCAGRCGSVVGASSRRLKGCGLDSHQGAYEKSMSVCLSLSLFPSL